MFVHRVRRWTSVKPILIQRLVSSGELSHQSSATAPDEWKKGEAFAPSGYSVVQSMPKHTVLFLPVIEKTLDKLNKKRYVYTAVQGQRAVSAYFTSKQILPFSFAEQYRGLPICKGPISIIIFGLCPNILIFQRSFKLNILGTFL